MVRISAAALCRIVIDGKHLLGYNKARLRDGKRVLTPLGGAIEVEDSGSKRLAQLGATFENPESKDLRLELPEASLTAFDEWFRRGVERERTPLRELREELIDEYGLLLPWSEPSVDAVTLHCSRGTTNRLGVAGRPTLRYIEMFDVAFNGACTALIREATRDEHSGLRLLAADEIARDGPEIADIARLVIDTTLRQRQ